MIHHARPPALSAVEGPALSAVEGSGAVRK